MLRKLYLLYINSSMSPNSANPVRQSATATTTMRNLRLRAHPLPEALVVVRLPSLPELLLSAPRYSRKSYNNPALYSRLHDRAPQ